jgi:hypothetical protein
MSYRFISACSDFCGWLRLGPARGGESRVMGPFEALTGTLTNNGAYSNTHV